LQRELIQAARTLLAAEVDRRLIDNVDPNAGHLRQLGPQLRHDLIDRSLALGPRLEVDREPALIQAAAAGPAADVAAHAGDVRILFDDLGHLLLVPHHLVERDALDGFDADVEAPLILAR